MIGILILSHGRLAEELAGAARTITSDSEKLEAVGLDWNEEPDIARGKISVLAPVGIALLGFTSPRRLQDSYWRNL